MCETMMSYKRTIRAILSVAAFSPLFVVVACNLRKAEAEDGGVNMVSVTAPPVVTAAPTDTAVATAVAPIATVAPAGAKHTGKTVKLPNGQTGAVVALSDGGTAIVQSQADGGIPGLPNFTIPTALPSNLAVPSSLPSGFPTTLPSGFHLPTFPTAAPTASH